MIQLTYYSRLPEPLEALREMEALALQRWEEDVGEVFDGFTKYQGTGHWAGVWEDSLTYVIVFSEVGVPNWEFCAKQFKLKLAETLAHEVLVTWHQLGGTL